MKPKGRDAFPFDRIETGAEYYSLTLGADENGKIWTEGPTHWTGFDEADDRIEIRVLSPVYPDRLAKIWKDFQEPFVVVNTDSDWGDWFLSGGHALIKPQILQAHMPWELEPGRYVREGYLGFTPVAALPKTAFNRAPTPKLRMQVMERDKYRCVLCGRRASDHVDVEIHVHHIRPFAQRGVTTPANLVSLCHTCHKGLSPHYKWDLYGFVHQDSERGGNDAGTTMHRYEYLKSVERYRKALAEDLRRFAAQSPQK